MRNDKEVIEVLTEDIKQWTEIIRRFNRDSGWYSEGVKRIRALKTAVEAIKDRDDLRDNCIEFGKDYWSDMFKIEQKVWATSDGVPVRESFCVTPVKVTTTAASTGDKNDSD